MRLGSRVSTILLGFGLGLTITLAASNAAASGVSGGGFGASAVTPLVSVPETPAVVLPSGGGNVADQVSGVSIAGVLSTGSVTVNSHGTIAPGAADATSVVTLENLSLLAGIVSASSITLQATSTGDGTTASSNITGTAVQNLHVGGMNFGNQLPAVNTVVNIPGVANVTVNEQVATGNGTTTSGLTVNLLHVKLLSLLGITVGDVVIGSVRTGVDVGPAPPAADSDADGIVDDDDNCPLLANANQLDTDEDGLGDVCDNDPDNDGIVGSADNCQLTPNIDQADEDGDDIGDVCDPDPNTPGGGGGGGGAVCGNGVVELPAEQCDLGAQNGTSGSTCTGACQTDGTGDTVLGCDGLALSSVVPAFVRRAVFRRTTDTSGALFSQWRSTLAFNVFPGTTLDPQRASGRSVISQKRNILDDAVVATKKAGNPAAAATHLLRMRKRQNKVRARLAASDVGTAVDVSATPLRIRTTLRVGDVCATAVLECRMNARGIRLRCKSIAQ